MKLIAIEEAYLDHIKTKLIPTGLYGKDNLEIFNSLRGQLSDGMWENSPRMGKYYTYIDYKLDDNNQVMIRVPESMGWHLDIYSETELKARLASYLKALVKEYLKYNEGEWKRDCTVRFDGWFHEPTPEIREVYRVYDALLGRKDRVGDTEVYLESTKYKYPGSQVINIEYPADYNPSEDEKKVDIFISWLFSHYFLFEKFKKDFDYSWDINNNEINKPTYSEAEAWLKKLPYEYFSDFLDYRSSLAPGLFQPDVYIEALGFDKDLNADLNGGYFYWLDKAEKDGWALFIVTDEDDPNIDSDAVTYEEFDTFAEARDFAKENGFERIIAHAFMIEGPNGYDNGDYVEFDDQWLSLSHELINKDKYVDDNYNVFLEARQIDTTNVIQINNAKFGISVDKSKTFLYKVRYGTGPLADAFVLYPSKNGVRCVIKNAVARAAWDCVLFFWSEQDAQEFLDKYWDQVNPPRKNKAACNIYKARLDPNQIYIEIDTNLGKALIEEDRCNNLDWRNYLEDDVYLESVTAAKPLYQIWLKAKNRWYVDSLGHLAVFDNYEEANDFINRNYNNEDLMTGCSIVRVPRRTYLNPEDIEVDDDYIYLESLEEDIEKHDELNPKLFENDNLKPEVKETIQKIADEFIKELNEDGIKFNLKDIVLLGSNVSYNYTKDSDLDIHLIAGSEGLECPDELYPLLYSAYRSIFNKNYDITIKDIPAEIYVEMDNVAALSNGIYSLNNGWIKKPVQQNIPDLDKEAFDELFKEWENRYFDLINKGE